MNFKNCLNSTNSNNSIALNCTFDLLNVNQTDYGLDYLNCSVPQTLSFARFFECYAFFYNIMPTKAILELGLAFFAILLNLLVMILILSDKNKINVFDKILVGHSIVDGDFFLY
jgi:hypothetical protein